LLHPELEFAISNDPLIPCPGTPNFWIMASIPDGPQYHYIGALCHITEFGNVKTISTWSSFSDGIQNQAESSITVHGYNPFNQFIRVQYAGIVHKPLGELEIFQAFQDLPAQVGIDYTSFLDTWWIAQDDTALWMQAPWVITYLDNVGTNLNFKWLTPSCNFTPRWEWTDSDSNHKSGPTEELFIVRAGTVSDRRVRVRGKGRALQMHYESSSGQPFGLLGWSVNLDRNAQY
jgi:hypothetical protein